jgi:GYF domain 2
VATCRICGQHYSILTSRHLGSKACNSCVEQGGAEAYAERSPPATAECYLWRDNRQEGPFTPGQIKSMWDSGAITADTLYYYPGLPDWRPVRSFCLNAAWQGSTTSEAALLRRVVAEQKRTSSLVWRVLAVIILVFVIVPLLYQCSQGR